MSSSGPPTFLFTDIEGSSRLWEQATATMERSVARHEAILTESIEAHSGRVVKTLGDGLYAVFPTAAEGVTAALGGMLGVLAEPWPQETPIKVRMGLHTGDAVEREGDFYGPPVNRTARLEAAAHGGQIVLSSVTAELAAPGLPETVKLLDIGEVRLRGLSAPERVSQVLAEGLASSFPPLEGIATPNNLPAPVTSFVGREDEMRGVLRVLAESRLVTLVGFGGTGKTRVAVEAATAATADYPDGVWFVDFSQIRSADLVTQTVASTVGVTEVPGEDLLETLTEWLAGKRVLVILDNCEHLVGEIAALAGNLLSSTDQLKMVATSRQGLSVPGEVVFELQPLATDSASSATGPAIRLFLDRARAARHGFGAVDDEMEAVVAICSHLDGIPLAIELAAARVRLLRPTQIAARLNDRFALLIDGVRTALPRQQTLRALVDWSYELLADEERSLFDRLSVFVGNFTVEAAEAVCGGDGVDQARVFDLLASLADQSLTRVDDSAEDLRFVLLETLQSYGSERLDASGDLDLYQEQHARWFEASVRGADQQLTGPDQGERHKRLDADQPDLLKALAWLADHQPDLGLEMAAELGRFWYRKGSTTMGRDVTSAALTAAGQQPTVARGHALAWMGFFVDVLGDSEEAWQLTLEALEIARQVSDDEGMAFALNGLGNRSDNAGRPRDAGEYWQQAIAALDRAGSPSVAAPLFNLGICLVELGELDEARPLADRLVSLAAQRDDPLASAKGQLLAGQIAHGQGRLEEAAELAETAEEIFLEQGVVFDAAEATLLRCGVAELQGNVERARQHFERARESLADTNAFDGAEAHILAARIALRAADIAAARESLRAAILVTEGSNNPLHQSALLHESARLAGITGRHQEALQLEAAAAAQRKEAALKAVIYQTEEAALLESAASAEIDKAQADQAMAHGAKLEAAAALQLAESLLD